MLVVGSSPSPSMQMGHLASSTKIFGLVVDLTALFAALAELADLLWEGLRVCEVVVGYYVVVEEGVE